MYSLHDLHIVTVATESKYYFPFLVQSCRRYGKELEVLGYGQKWEGFSMKFKLMIEYLETLDDDDIVCFIDGHDVICTRNLNELKNTFLKLYFEKKCKIIVGYDNNNHTNFINKLIVKMYFGTCNNLSLNSGTYIGLTKDLLQMLKQIRNYNCKNEADDQILMTKYCSSNLSSVYIDNNNEIFLTLDKPLNEIDNLVDIDENYRLSYNDNFPFFLHAPGSTYLDNILKRLKYKSPNINEIIKYKYGYLHILVNQYTNLFAFSVLLLIVLCVLFLVKLCNVNRK